MVEKNEFFRNAALRICGRLEIEKALWECFIYIADHIPAQEAYLLHREKDSLSTSIYAHADRQGGRLPGKRFQLPAEARKMIARQDFSGELLINRADDHILGKTLLTVLEKERISALYIRLIVEETSFGSLVLMAEGFDRFNPGHLDLLKLLKQPAAIALANSLRFQELSEIKDLLADENRFLQKELRSATGSEIIGAESGLKKTMALVDQVSYEDTTVLLLGETGVGKEVIATAIHNQSKRRTRPFVKVNCGSIPETLIDSELFGHEKGSFTGAHQTYRGRFERADGGTLFLDEIGELPPAAQVKLLRVIQEKEIERVGGSQTVKVNVRLIIATHRDLWRMVKAGGFREDLFYRINVFPITVPPLRDRRVDISDLLHHFLSKKSRLMGLPTVPGIVEGEIERLSEYSWPGNVRELENLVERSLILDRKGPIRFQSLMQGPEAVSRMNPSGKPPAGLNTVISNHISMVLAQTRGRINGEDGAARLLGVNPSTLRHKMRRLNIDFGRKGRSSGSIGEKKI